MKEAICSKCGDVYNPEEFGDVHFANDCNGEPISEGKYNQTETPFGESCRNSATDEVRNDNRKARQ